VSVRVAEPQDAPAVARLLGEFRTTFFGRSEPSDESLHSSVERLIRDKETEYLLAGGEDPAGVAQLRYRESLWSGKCDCWLEDLFVREEARGEGLGGALVVATIERSRARGCARIELDTQATNRDAIALYERHGFERGLLMRLDL
jgi:ribosomal protein S18 acetylase RimI-like enzyme